MPRLTGSDVAARMLRTNMPYAKEFIVARW
jgi:hypothetical protein